MIDNVFIHISSGKGGDGTVNGRREKFVPRGGPDGGDGGRGGSVFAECDSNMNTLLAFRYERRFAAGDGGNGMPALKHGADGEDIAVRMPVGTQVWDAESRSHRLLADLTEHGQSVLSLLAVEVEDAATPSSHRRRISTRFSPSRVNREKHFTCGLS